MGFLRGDSAGEGYSGIVSRDLDLIEGVSLLFGISYISIGST